MIREIKDTHISNQESQKKQVEALNSEVSILKENCKMMQETSKHINAKINSIIKPNTEPTIKPKINTKNASHSNKTIKKM